MPDNVYIVLGIDCQACIAGEFINQLILNYRVSRRIQLSEIDPIHRCAVIMPNDTNETVAVDIRIKIYGAG